MLSLEKAQEIIEKEINSLDIPAEPKNLYEPVRYILSKGGKRFRPVLVLLACDMLGGDYKKAIYPALGIEVFHNFTLVHDDVMDNSSLRRNRPTVHVKWDQNTAILSGDVMSILANTLVNKASADKIQALSKLFSKTAIEVCEGQMLDMLYATKENVTIQEYIKMISLKTSVLVAASLGSGAIVAGADEKEISKLYNFGLNLGIAFQLQDDMLDSYGKEESFGKRIGNDIVTNKRTFLLVKAFEKSFGKDLVKLKRYFSSTDFENSEKIEKVMAIYEKLDIKAETEKAIAEYHQKALQYLKDVKADKESKKVITDFSAELMKRQK